LVTNRSAARARELASDLGGKTVPFSRIGDAMSRADIVISSSSAPEFLIGREHTKHALAQRNGRPLLLIDIAVPRDIDPAVRDMPNVHLYDIDDLQARVEHGRDSRRGEVSSVERIVAGGVRDFQEWMRARGVAPTITALRERADTLRESELERTFRRLRDLTPAQRERVEAMADALVRKMLHDPIDRLKGEDGERYVGVLRELFALDADAAAPSANGDSTSED
jgi:glutamyl-tRNA reductase